MDWFKKIGSAVGRLTLGLVTLAAALAEATVAFATARGSEVMSARLAETWLQGDYSEEFWVLGEVRPELRAGVALAMEWAPVLLFALPISAILARSQRAREHAQESLADVKQQVQDFVSGKIKNGSLDSMQALLRPIQPLLLAILPIGACPLWDNHLPDFMQAETKIREVVQYRVRLVPTTNRIHFGKARLDRDETLKSEGSDLPAVEKEALERTVRQLELGPERRATVTLYGFASDEEFTHLACKESNRKNLEVSDHRANAVYNELKALEAKHGWLTVNEPKRWLPAENKATAIAKQWQALQKKRSELVPQPGKQEFDCDARGRGSRDPESDSKVKKREAWRDRVVVLRWTVDETCEMPGENEGAVTETQQAS